MVASASEIDQDLACFENRAATYNIAEFKHLKLKLYNVL
jgi:hypothetical protein